MYTDDELKRLKKVEIEILNDFIFICDSNHLEYFLFAGSAIGAIRHKGFIPWDDDIDVGLNRKDYDKLLDIIRTQYNDKYILVNNDSFPSIPVMNTRLSLRGTLYIPEDFKYIKNKECLGIFLDLYCFDNVPDDKKKCSKQVTKAWLYGKLSVLASVKYPVLYYRGPKRIIMRVLCIIGYYFLNILHLNTNFFYKKAMYYSKLYINDNTKKFAYMFDPKRYSLMLDKTDVYPTKFVKFEGLDVRVAKNVDKMLRLAYGDYMKIPKVEERHYHPPYILDFGDKK